MTKPILLLVAAMFAHTVLLAQSNLLPGTRIRDNKLYLKLEKNELRAFVKKDNEAGSEALDETKKFAMDSKDCNVYVQWQNPLRYQWKWADSAFDDETDAAVQSYITKLVEMFGSPVSKLNENKAQSAAAFAQYGFAKSASGVNELHYPANVFKSLQLTFLYLQLRQHKPALDSADISHLNALEDDITTLDRLNGVNIASTADTEFKKLFDIKSAQQLEAQLPDIKSTINNLEPNQFKTIEETATALSKALISLSLSDKFLEAYYKNVVTEFINEALTNLASNRELIKKFEPVIKLMEASIEIPGDVQNASSGAKTEYYKERNIKLANSKGLHTALSLVEKEYDPKSHEYKVKSETKKAVMQFREYNAISVFVSTGTFLANTTLRSYGVDKDLRVTEDTVNKNNFVAAAFLNFSFLRNRIASPLVQIGIDPTKKHPFMLLGGGFVLPTARFALTAGGVWTWQASLRDLQPGQQLESSTDLDENISYKFNIEPKGWYIGLQYNF